MSEGNLLNHRQLLSEDMRTTIGRIRHEISMLETLPDDVFTESEITNLSLARNILVETVKLLDSVCVSLELR